MFEGFTDRAREVVVLAREEARDSGQRNIGTEHLLLGLLDQDDGIASRALGSLGVTADRVRNEIQIQHPWLSGERFDGQIPFTRRAASVLELSLRERLRMGHDAIGPEHVLLGIVAANNGVAIRVLSSFGVEPVAIVQAVDELFPTAGGPVLARRERGFPQTDRSIDDWYPMPASDSLRRLLVTAAGAADFAKRTELELPDLLSAMTNYVSAGLLAGLGIDAEGLRTAVQSDRQNSKGPRSDEPVPTAGLAGSVRVVSIEVVDDERPVGCGERVRGLLEAAGARTLKRGGAAIEVSDVLLVLARDEQTSATLASLGVDVIALRAAIERHDASG